MVWWFGMQLVGDGSILNGADIPSDANVWESFTPAFLTMTFQQIGVADVLRITAQVDSFAAVPEPSLVALCVIFVAAGSAIFGRKRLSLRL
jgi:hypothetical protein